MFTSQVSDQVRNDKKQDHEHRNKSLNLSEQCIFPVDHKCIPRQAYTYIDKNGVDTAQEQK
ncbi:hypothetical protein FHR92_001221 [Fontibacillus solani]|uniref:Uncharacterized protein n=1 Tax=Fontibacillus solani TaxID=1572857 RepID=A0A7W3SR83_9BACL|nr:hypothetical protein [Fontibacillus solani]MBA9084760.1 hypothetical protein [Fontibacillus solani]